MRRQAAVATAHAGTTRGGGRTSAGSGGSGSHRRPRRDSPLGRRPIFSLATRRRRTRRSRFAVVQRGSEIDTRCHSTGATRSLALHSQPTRTLPQPPIPPAEPKASGASRPDERSGGRGGCFARTSANSHRRGSRGCSGRDAQLPRDRPRVLLRPERAAGSARAAWLLLPRSSRYALTTPIGVEQPHSGRLATADADLPFVVVQASRRRLHALCSVRMAGLRRTSRSVTARSGCPIRAAVPGPADVAIEER